MILTCFACNATGSIEAFTKDEAASEFVNLAGSLQPSMWQALLAYLGLFRTSRKMPFKQALKLSREVVALDPDLVRLEAALSATVESMRVKQEEGTFRPLKNHRYLLKVLADTLSPHPSPARGEGTDYSLPVDGRGQSRGGTSKTARAMDRLDQWGKG